jgi:hypothetical protein
MDAHAPTYFLGSDFREKLRQYVDRVLADGREHFRSEFSRLDDYLRRAAMDTHGESLRLTSVPEYLLELIAFQIHDAMNRESFNRARRTLIVMPDCLSLHNPDCLKEDLPHGDECRQCTAGCQANQIVDLADKFGAEAVFSKRKLMEQLDYYRDRLGDFGVVGVACIKMLAGGMRDAAEAEVPARGVLLNFSGCEHWNDRPCASEFALDWLREILQEKYDQQHPSADHSRL